MLVLLLWFLKLTHLKVSNPKRLIFVMLINIKRPAVDVY